MRTARFPMIPLKLRAIKMEMHLIFRKLNQNLNKLGLSHSAVQMEASCADLPDRSGFAFKSIFVWAVAINRRTYKRRIARCEVKKDLWPINPGRDSNFLGFRDSGKEGTFWMLWSLRLQKCSF